MISSENIGSHHTNIIDNQVLELMFNLGGGRLLLPSVRTHVDPEQPARRSFRVFAKKLCS